MKKLLIIVAFVVVAMFAGLAALVLLINPNQFKPLIVEQTKQATGLDLVIDGDISWQLFPTLGFAIGKTEMRNPDGFDSKNLFQVNAIDVSVEIMPLFSKQLKVGNVSLNGANIQLETLQDGRTNLDNFTASGSTENSKGGTNNTNTSVTVSRSEQPKAADAQSQSDWTINVAGVSVHDSSLGINNRQAGSQIKLQIVDLSVSEFSPGEWSQVKFDLKGSSNGQQFGAKGGTAFNLSKDFQTYALRDLAADVSFKDATNDIKNARLSLDQFEPGKPANVKFSVDGVVAEMALAMSGQMQLLVDPLFKSVKASELQMDADVKGEALPSSPLKVSLDSDVQFDIGKGKLTAMVNKLTANDIALDGSVSVALADVPEIRFNFHSPDVDLDKFLGLNKASDVPATTDSQPENNDAVSPAAMESEPDLSTLKTLDIAGTVAIDKLKANNLEMSNMLTEIAVNCGVVTLESFKADLYQGSMAASGKLDARKSPAVYSMKTTASGVQIEPILAAMADSDVLSGTGNIVANITGKSLVPGAMMKNLAGTTEINFADGAVKGANIAQMIRTGYAKIKGQALSADDKAEKKTDFSALTATIKMKNGVASTSNLAMQSPLLRIHGKGNSDYIQQTMNFWLDTSVVGSLEGQGGKDVQDLKDVTIPVEIKGNWLDPNIDIALDVVFKQRAQNKIDKEVSKLQDKIDSKLNDEKTKEKVNSLLKKLF